MPDETIVTRMSPTSWRSHAEIANFVAQQTAAAGLTAGPPVEEIFMNCPDPIPIRDSEFIQLKLKYS
jgi:hypothetical protein